MPAPRTSAADATLGAFEPPVRAMAVPLLMYKSVFLGDWFDAVARREEDPAVRAALLGIARDTLREAIELIDALRPWDSLLPDVSVADDVASTLNRRILHDLLAFKEGNAEAILFLAMRAPTDELRRLLVRLADRDRKHADALRTVLGASTLRRAREHAGQVASLGAREARTPGGTLGGSLRADIERLRGAGTMALRLVVSPAALRHLRDEGLVDADATVMELPVDVDFGWGGECHAFITDERVRLAEILTEGAGPHP